MTIAECAILGVLIAAVVVSLGLAFRSAGFDYFPQASFCSSTDQAAGSGGRAGSIERHYQGNDADKHPRNRHEKSQPS
jgi:hypothetical protein